MTSNFSSNGASEGLSSVSLLSLKHGPHHGAQKSTRSGLPDFLARSTASRKKAGASSGIVKVSEGGGACELPSFHGGGSTL
jgi:hypothetical protein